MTKSVAIVLSGQYLTAIQGQTGNPLQNGKFIDSTPRWSGAAFVEYHPPACSALSLNAGVYYTGKRFTDALDQGVLPAYATLSLGTSYKMPMASGHAITLRVNADNVTNKRYWSTGGTTLYVGLAHVVRASATVDF